METFWCLPAQPGCPGPWLLNGRRRHHRRKTDLIMAVLKKRYIFIVLVTWLDHIQFAFNISEWWCVVMYNYLSSKKPHQRKCHRV